MAAAPSPTSSRTSSGLVEGVDVDAVHDAVLACPGVADLGGSMLGALATYLPGRRVPGVRVTSESIELEVKAAWESSATEIARSIRAALSTIAPAHRIDINLVDIEVPGEADAGAGNHDDTDDTDDPNSPGPGDATPAAIEAPAIPAAIEAPPLVPELPPAAPLVPPSESEIP